MESVRGEEKRKSKNCPVVLIQAAAEDGGVQDQNHATTLGSHQLKKGT